KRLDDELFFSNHLVNEQTETALRSADDDDEILFLLFRFLYGVNAAELVEADESKDLVAQAKHFALVHAMNLHVRDARDFDDGRKRDGEKTAADTEEKCLDAGESERCAKLNRRAFARLSENVDGSLEPIENGTNDVHTDATAGDFGNFAGGTETRLENEVE